MFNTCLTGLIQARRISDKIGLSSSARMLFSEEIISSSGFDKNTVYYHYLPKNSIVFSIYSSAVPLGDASWPLKENNVIGIKRE